MASIAENQQTAAVASTVNPMNLVTASEDVISSTLTVQGTVDRLNMSCQLNSGVHVMSSIKAIAEVPTGNGGGEKRQDIELALVIDKSGSMHGEKINSVRETLLLLQKQMGGQDSVSLVTFDTQVKCVMPLTKLKGSLEKERFKRCVEKISSGSSTNLSGGLAEGIKQLKQSN